MKHFTSYAARRVAENFNKKGIAFSYSCVTIRLQLDFNFEDKNMTEKEQKRLRRQIAEDIIEGDPINAIEDKYCVTIKVCWNNRQLLKVTHGLFGIVFKMNLSEFQRKRAH